MVYKLTADKRIKITVYELESSTGQWWGRQKLQHVCTSCSELNEGAPVNQSDDDVLYVDVLMQLSAGTQERIQRLKVELIGENLTKTRQIKAEQRAKQPSRTSRASQCRENIFLKAFQLNQTTAIKHAHSRQSQPEWNTAQLKVASTVTENPDRLDRELEQNHKRTPLEANM